MVGITSSHRHPFSSRHPCPCHVFPFPSLRLQSSPVCLHPLFLCSLCSLLGLFLLFSYLDYFSRPVFLVHSPISVCSSLALSVLSLFIFFIYSLVFDCLFFCLFFPSSISFFSSVFLSVSGLFLINLPFLHFLFFFIIIHFHSLIFKLHVPACISFSFPYPSLRP